MRDRVSLFIAVILLLIAAVLVMLLGPLCFLFAMFTLGRKENYAHYLSTMALSLDQFANVVAAPLFNRIMIDRSFGYRFGDPDETISSCLGKNRQIGSLTRLGMFLDAILDLIDPNHSIDAIEVNP